MLPTLESSDERQDLVRRQIEGMECEPPLLVLDERKEAEGAVVDPADE